MYLNTPNSAYNTWTDGSQPPSTPTHAPRIGARGLPPCPHTPVSPMTPYPGAYAPYAMPHGHTIAYGLMTPPDSPDKPTGRVQDFHPVLDVRGPPLVFDIRQSAPLSSDAAHAPAINHPVRVLHVNMGPLSFDIANNRGTQLTVFEVIDGLIRALTTVEATPQEVAVAVSMGFAHPSLPQRGVPRSRLIDLKPYFGGFTLRSVRHGVAVVDCHLRAHV